MYSVGRGFTINKGCDSGNYLRSAYQMLSCQLTRKLKEKGLAVPSRYFRSLIQENLWWDVLRERRMQLLTISSGRRSGTLNTRALLSATAQVRSFVAMESK